MADIDNLINDIQEYLEDKEPAYLKRQPRLHPDNLLYAAAVKIEEMLFEIDDLREELKDCEYEIRELERYTASEKD